MRCRNAKPPCRDNRVLVSVVTLRRTIGVLGVVLPGILAIGGRLLYGCPLQPSISAYYHTSARNLFVGVLFVVAFYMFAYRGHETKDNRLGDLACIAALGVALFPVSEKQAGLGDIVHVLHYVSAILLFGALAAFCLWLFPKSDLASPRKWKLRRNRVYRACGWTMLLCMALVPILSGADSLAKLRPVFWLESILLLAFGLSWFVKGDTLLKDR